jgi:AraC-like DNA-binding protein
MRRLGKTTPEDGLSQLLLRVTVSSTVYCLSEMTAPWGFRVASRPIPAFHLLTSGSAWLEVEGRSGGVRIVAGDLIVLPRGTGHQVRDTRESRVQWLDDILAERPPVNGRLKHGGGGERAELICGGFAIDQVMARPLLESLPQVIHLRGHQGRAPEWLAGLIRMISVEMASDKPGAEAVVSHLSDALLAQALREPMLAASEAMPSALGDSKVARALRLIREHPEEPWTVPRLASEVGLSRAAFAKRFRALTGETPIRSLTRLRLSRAANYLASTDAGLGEIARRTGYDSEASISKAFRRHFGTSPRHYRKSAALT